MLPILIILVGLIYAGVQYQIDYKIIAGTTLIIGLISGAFAWLVGVIGLVPVVGPLVVKVLSLSVIWLLNALGYIVSYVAIRRGYSQDVLTYRGLTIALIIGIVIGFVLGGLIFTHWFLENQSAEWN